MMFPRSLSFSLSIFLSVCFTKIRPRMFHCGETCRFSCVGHTCAPHVHVCACGWTWIAMLPRYRSSSWPPRVMPYPLALHNNLPRRVCSGISARTLPPALLFPLPRPPSLLSLDRCYGRVFRPSFIRLLALRELGAVGVPFLVAPSAICLPTRCTVSRFSSYLTGSFMEIKFYLNEKIRVNVSHFFDRPIKNHYFLIANAINSFK